MKIAAIVRTNLVRTLRDRTALFFSIILPLILILVLGLTYGAGGSARIGVVILDDGPLGTALVDAVRTASGISVETTTYSGVDALRDAAARGIVSVGLAIPAGYSDALASGGTADVTVMTPPTQRASAIRTLVDDAVARERAIVRAAQFNAAQTGAAFPDALAAARARGVDVAGVAVAIEPVNAATNPAGVYAAGAQSQLVLFMFLTSLTGAIELVITRQLGISRRMFSTPTGAWTIITGESLGRIAFALVQGLFIVLASAVLFGVRWGDPLGVAVVVLVFSFVAGGASMIVGSVARTPSQAGALGPALAMLVGLIGGAMVPLELFPPTMRTVARLTPHAWAMDALGSVTTGAGGVLTVVPQLLVLTGFAVLFFGVAVARFRRTLVGSG